MWNTGDVIANGIRLHYYCAGKEGHPLVVLCHGFTDNGLCWTPIAQALAADYKVVAYDARGHGLSDAPEQGYALEDFAGDLLGLIRALGLRRPAVIGHSWGGATAALAAARAPDLIGKLILEDPAWWEEDSPWLQEIARDREGYMARQREELERLKAAPLDALIADCRQRCPQWPEAELEPWATSKHQLSLRILNVYRHKPPRWREAAKALRCPTLLLTADVEKGGLVTPALAERARSLNPLIQEVHFAEAGHSIRRDAPDAYLDAVRQFLQSAG